MKRRISIGVLAAVVVIGAAWGIARWQRPAVAADTFAVIDGDTLERTPRHCLLARIGIACIPQRLRLFGVDAFESKQYCHDDKGSAWPCGAVATARLRTLVAHTEFGCHVDHEFIDRHAREFAVCTANGEDVGAILVREGLAFAYGRGAHYLQIESAAKAEKRGAWAGSFVRPQYFREGAVN